MDEQTRIHTLRKRIKALLIFFIAALLASGITAFPLQWEINLLVKTLGPTTRMAQVWPALSDWIGHVHEGLTAMHSQYPFLAYGTDWLAFAHIVIAMAFIGPLRDPVKNIWVIEFSLIACVLVVPLAIIAGPLRGIPFFWRLIDSAFGVFGFIPLWLVRQAIRRLETSLARQTTAEIP